jgi:chain length determinant protein EpsF
LKLSRLFVILLARKHLIAMSIAVCLGVAMLLSLVLPKTYKASSQVVLSISGTDPVTGLATSPQYQLQGYLATQVGIITSRTVALKVVEALKLTEDEKLRREFEKKRRADEDIHNWLADRLLKNLEATPFKDSGIIQISSRWDDPKLAAAIANGFANQYRQATIQIKTNPLDEVGGYFDIKLKELRTTLEQARNRMSQYQRENGIVNVDARLDHENMRLNDLSSQLATVQNQLSDANSRWRQAQGQRPEDLPDVAASPVIQGLKTSLAAANARLAQIENQYMPEHPTYIRAQAEVERIKQELRKNTRDMANSVGSNALILKQREQDLRQALQEQKERLLALNTQRDHLTMLTHDVENAQRSYDNTIARASQVNLEGHAKQTDASLLSEAVVPTEAASPKTKINLLLSVILGAMVGAAIAFICEMLNRKVRAASDLADALEKPVIGVMEWGTRKKPSTPRLLGPKLLRIGRTT